MIQMRGGGRRFRDFAGVTMGKREKPEKWALM
jgi:hypothetical protein